MGWPFPSALQETTLSFSCQKEVSSSLATARATAATKFRYEIGFQFPIQSYINIAVADAVEIDIVNFHLVTFSDCFKKSSKWYDTAPIPSLATSELLTMSPFLVVLFMFSVWIFLNI